MVYSSSRCTLFFYDEVSKSIYRFVAVQVLPDSVTNLSKPQEAESLSKSKIHKPRKYFINIDDSQSSVGRIMILDKSETLLCIKTSPRSLKVITNLDSMKYKKFCTIDFPDLANIIEMKLVRSGVLAILGEKGNPLKSVHKPKSFSGMKATYVTGLQQQKIKKDSMISAGELTSTPLKRLPSEDSNLAPGQEWMQQGQEFVLRFVEFGQSVFKECGSYQFELDSDEKIDCMSICQRGKFVVAATSSQSQDNLKRLIVLEIDSLTFEALKVFEKCFGNIESTDGKNLNLENSPYGPATSPNFFSSVYIDYYKEGRPVIVAYQQNSPRGVFVGVCKDGSIQEVNFYYSYHSYSCYGAKWTEEGYVSFGERDAMKILGLVNVSN